VTSLCPMFWYGDVLRNSQFSRRVYVAHISLFAILLPISSTILPHYFLFFLLSLSCSSTFLPPFHSTPSLPLLSVIPSAHDLSNPISFHSLRKTPLQNPTNPSPSPIQLQYPQPQPIPTHENPRLQETAVPIPILTLSTPATYKPYIHKPTHQSPYKPQPNACDHDRYLISTLFSKEFSATSGGIHRIGVFPIHESTSLVRSSSMAWGIGGMRAGKGVASVRLLLAGMWGYGVCGLWIFWHGLNLGGGFFFFLGTGFMVLWVWCWCFWVFFDLFLCLLFYSFYPFFSLLPSPFSLLPSPSPSQASTQNHLP